MTILFRRWPSRQNFRTRGLKGLVRVEAAGVERISCVPSVVSRGFTKDRRLPIRAVLKVGGVPGWKGHFQRVSKGVGKVNTRQERNAIGKSCDLSIALMPFSIGPIFRRIMLV